ncbi:short-chain dehydrogenase/reductase SDR [Oceanococcus atlanticus]|uniref:Short-chain dehydrogenase/reductase SDR n=1 Tax=Oceanococcus atlanticus TaxID=1317117 RepID=A0A1Y1SCJ5_9GAMM|nr:SDR family NAD(P)-dependent oxidoreductase [Oceanococcus atlanticus]ORE86342.1 short-chain dehydrogenase/reductase SDR [Oceanococcus atlanticus]
MAAQSRHDRGILRRFLRDALSNRMDNVRRKRRQALHARSSDTRAPAALIFGVGASPGIGAALAQRAAQEGMVVYAAGRNPQKLEACVDEIRAAGHQAVALTVDVTQPKAIQAAFESVVRDGHRLDLVIHNVGTNRPTPFLEISPDGLEQRWKADCRSGFLVAQQAVACMLEYPERDQGRGTILFTGASASLRGKAGFAAFAQAKAGLRMLSQALAREFGPQGIHVAHVIVDGAVDGHRLREHLSDAINAKGEDGCLNPQSIAETYWALHQQHRSVWTQELDLRPFKEAW